MEWCSSSVLEHGGIFGTAPAWRWLLKWLQQFDSFPGNAAGKHANVWYAGRGGALDPKPTPDEPGTTMNSYHEPVLLQETMAALRVGPGKRFVDATLGGGGHARAMLRAGAEVVGLDQDEDALKEAERWRESVDEEERLVLLQSNFRRLGSLFETIGCGKFDGILFDLGVSSFQLDEASRGFSFQQDGPLDMRMDHAGPLTAADLVNHYPEERLVEVFSELGEEKHARRIARAIVRMRERAPLERTLELARLVESAVPGRGRRHPATRVFQALRMEVNDELGSLREALAAAIHWIKPGGRLAVITFHSLEDRLVKTFLRQHSERWLNRPEWPEPRLNPDFCLDLCPRKGIKPSAEEVTRNPRARSALLRVAQLEASGLLA